VARHAAPPGFFCLWTVALHGRPGGTHLAAQVIALAGPVAGAQLPSGLLVGTGGALTVAPVEVVIAGRNSISSAGGALPPGRDLLQALAFTGTQSGRLTAAAGVDVAQVAGEPVGVALEIEMGRAFVWGDEWIQYDSEWSAMPMITQLWSNLVNWVGPQDRCMVLI